MQEFFEDPAVALVKSFIHTDRNFIKQQMAKETRYREAMQVG
jgi:hypothetical protein